MDKGKDNRSMNYNNTSTGVVVAGVSSCLHLSQMDVNTTCL